MREIGSFEAKNKLSAFLDQVEHGAEIVITRHGKAVAKLVPAELGFDRKKAKRAAAGLREVTVRAAARLPRAAATANRLYP